MTPGPGCLSCDAGAISPWTRDVVGWYRTTDDKAAVVVKQDAEVAILLQFSARYVENAQEKVCLSPT